MRYDVSHCLTEYNTSRDLKGCAAALLAIMATCDPVVPPMEAPRKTVSSTDSVNVALPQDNLEPKLKQNALLSVVSREIKGAMIEEVSHNKSIRAKLRTWFVRAHKDNSYVVLQGIISVLDKLTFLTAQSLAEVKFGKALVIVSRKCENQEVKDALSKWIPKAEDSLIIERELEIAASKAPPLEEDTKKKKPKVLSSSSATKPGSKALSPPQTNAANVKKGEDKAKVSLATKKIEPVAKVNTAFFKKETPSNVKPVISKSGMAAALAGIKARKKSDAERATEELAESRVPTTSNSSTTSTPSAVSKPVPIAKAGFSALKLVAGLKRNASPVVATEAEPEIKRRKQKKRVSWRPDAELEQIQIFESVEPEDGAEDVAHTPHEYGNARDLDRKEGALLHGGVLPDREEDFLDWATPKSKLHDKTHLMIV